MVLTKKMEKIETYFCEKCGKKLLEQLPNGNKIIYGGCSHYIWHIIPYDYYQQQRSEEGKKYVEWLKKNKEIMIYTGKDVYFLMKK
jgi:adenine-specific DNA methylase